MVGSFCPDGVKAIDAVLDSAAGVKAFYDIDTPITVSKLRAGDAEYLRHDQIPGLQIYISASPAALCSTNCNLASAPGELSALLFIRSRSLRMAPA